MLDPGEFDPVVHFVHVVLGFGSAAFGIVALASSKGGLWHRRAGQAFAVCMVVAAITAIHFFVVGPPAPPVLISALAAIYGIAMAILSLNRRTGRWLVIQRALITIPIVIGLLYATFPVFVLLTPDLPLYSALLGAAAGTLFLVMGWKDIAFLRETDVGRPRRQRRHGFRMALVAAEVVRAPAISLGPPFLGEATFEFYSYGPFLLVPLFYFLAMPKRLRPQRGAEVLA